MRRYNLHTYFNSTYKLLLGSTHDSVFLHDVMKFKIKIDIASTVLV